MAVIVVGVVGYLYYTGGMPIHREKPWYFKGAYVNYSISGFAMFFPVKGEAWFVVLDYNSTHLKVKTVEKLEEPVTDMNISVDWEPLNSTLGMDENCTELNESNTTYAGVRVVKVSYVCYKENETRNETYIIDPKTNVPIRITMEDDVMKMWMVLTDTNVPELQVFTGKG